MASGLKLHSAAFDYAGDSRQGSTSRDSLSPVTANFDPTEPSASDEAIEHLAAAWIGSEAPELSSVSGEERVVRSIGETPPRPPRHLAANIAAAGRAWDSLAAAGRHVAFEQGPDGRVTIELQDDHGNRLESVDPVQLFDLIDRESGE